MCAQSVSIDHYQALCERSCCPAHAPAALAACWCPLLTVCLRGCVSDRFDNIFGCRHSLPDGLMRATDVMLAGKRILIAGYGDVGKGCAQAMKGQGARVLISEVDPICALQALMEGYQVVRLNDVIGEVDIVVTATGNKGILMVEQIARMKNNAIIGNIGHFDNEIDMAGLQKFPGIKRINIKPQVDKVRASLPLTLPLPAASASAILPLPAYPSLTVTWYCPVLLGRLSVGVPRRACGDRAG